jgi:hypothetical protein
MKGDAVGYMVVMWIHPGPNLNLNAEHFRNVGKYGLKWPSFKHILLHSLTDTTSSGLSGYINQMFWLHLKDSEYLICNQAPPLNGKRVSARRQTSDSTHSVGSKEHKEIHVLK